MTKRAPVDSTFLCQFTWLTRNSFNANTEFGGLRMWRAELRAPLGRKIIAQGKRSAALGNEASMNIPLSSFSVVPPRRGGTTEKDERLELVSALPRAAVAALLCP